MRGNSHAQFLEGRTGAIPFGYSILVFPHRALPVFGFVTRLGLSVLRVLMSFNYGAYNSAGCAVVVVISPPMTKTLPSDKVIE